MEEWNPMEDEIDWLTGEYTYKQEKLKKALQNSKESCEVM